MIPARFAPIAISLLLSGCMSFLVSGVATYRAVGLPEGFFGLWMSAWMPAWAVAFPTMFLLRPVVTRLVMSVVRETS